jgi:hypothetical protein
MDDDDGVLNCIHSFNQTPPSLLDHYSYSQKYTGRDKRVGAVLFLHCLVLSKATTCRGRKTTTMKADSI